MRASAVAGIIIANSHDSLLGKLTSIRSMAAVPFGTHYRIVDFALSNLVNAGITNVGIITKGNYRSLMDHIGSGIAWDLDRKKGGLHIIPPFNVKGSRRYHGSVEALESSMDFLKRSHADYIVICESDTVTNIDIEAVVDAHIDSGADATLVYAHGKSPENHPETMLIKLDGDRITDAQFSNCAVEKCDYTLGITVIGSEILRTLIKSAASFDAESFNCDILAERLNSLKINGYCHKDFSVVMDSEKTYYNANMEILKQDTRKDLFSKERPIYTKTRDDMPTRYGTKAVVLNSFIGDGCVIDGTVKNCIVFRGVKVEKGAVIENSIIMQGSTIKAGANLDYVVADKNVAIGEKLILKGTPESTFFVEKNQTL